MGGGNGAKAATARARKAEKDAKAAKGSQLKANEKALTLKCAVCLTQFICTSKEQQLKDHQENKHPKSTFAQCFPDWKAAA